MLATKLEPAQGTINTVLFNMGQFATQTVLFLLMLI